MSFRYAVSLTAMSAALGCAAPAWAQQVDPAVGTATTAAAEPATDPDVSTATKANVLSGQPVSTSSDGDIMVTGTRITRPNIASAAPITSVTAQDIKDIYKRIDQVDAATNGVDPKLVVEAITKGSEKLDRILMEAKQIRSPNVQRRINHIDATGRKIIEDFRIDPKDVLLAQSWLNSYLDETIQLVKGYAQLSRAGARNLEAQKQMAQFDDMLDTIDENFQKLLDRLLSNDVMDFDVNMTVMKNRLSNEGI